MPESSDRRQRIGRRGEELASAYLAGQGYTILARNWRTRRGEIDIVAQDGACLALVEVRTRTVSSGAGPALGPPEDSVTKEKRRRLAAMAQAYVFESDWVGPYRVDVVAVELDREGRPRRISHYRDAVEG